MADALKPLVHAWMCLLNKANEHKKKEFQDDADICARFLDGPYDWLYKPRGQSSQGFDMDVSDVPAPTARITVNKTAELVQLFGPAIYHRNPIRKANPTKGIVPTPEFILSQMPPLPQVPDPMMAQQMQMQQQMMVQQLTDQLNAAFMAKKQAAELMEKYINYTPNALDLKTHSRWAMTEALIKGAGILLTKVHKPAGSVQKFVGSFYTSINNLQVDPDAEVQPDIKWKAIRCVHPVWQVEDEYGIPRGTLKATPGMESYTAQASVAADGDDYRRKQGRTADLLVYWKIYSKMGMGGRLVDVSETHRQKYDLLGNFVYLVVADGVPYPLNLPPPLCDAFADGAEAQLQQLLPEIQRRCMWETPYWADDEWCDTMFAFHFKPNQLWPMSHLKPGIGELMFLNWAWSSLAMKVHASSRDFIAIAKSAGTELKNIIKHGANYSVIELENIQGSIDQVVKFLQHPTFNPEIYKVIEGVTAQFDKRTGLTELMYGMSARQMRSAQEAQLKSDAINVRPDDMANAAEDAMTACARKEAFAARWHLTGADVVRVLGEAGAQLWDQLIVNGDPANILYQVDYRIEANSARKPNKAKEAEDMQSAVQMLFQPLFDYASATGNVGPINALIEDWARSIDIDPEQYLLQPPPPPPPPPEAGLPQQEGPPA